MIVNLATIVIFNFTRYSSNILKVRWEIFITHSGALQIGLLLLLLLLLLQNVKNFATRSISVSTTIKSQMSCFLRQRVYHNQPLYKNIQTTKAVERRMLAFDHVET